MTYTYDHRYLARIVVEAETPLAVGTGKKHLLSDSPICVDIHGLPMIPGTGLAGVLRHLFASQDAKLTDQLFGYQKDKQEEGEGSRLIVSNAHLWMGKDKCGNDIVIEGMVSKEQLESPYLQGLTILPIRQHCRINHRGVNDQEEHGKFDGQVVPKGVRFVFEMELIGTQEDQPAWERLLSLISAPLFRIGGGTRKGFGKLKIILDRSQSKCLNLHDAKHLQEYLNKSSSLQHPLHGETLKPVKTENTGCMVYNLSLIPENSWMFGSGFGDKEADMTPVYEKIIEWNHPAPKFSEQMILIPSTSVKGAISHRVAFHYNRLTGVFADKIESIQEHVGVKNLAVRTLFGDDSTQIGQVIFSDVFQKDEKQTKVLNHVSIDRFTGGARDTALFNEKVIAQRSEIKLEICVIQAGLQEPKIKEAFETTLKEICWGMLPLGGGVMRGHGILKGSVRPNRYQCLRK